MSRFLLAAAACLAFIPSSFTAAKAQVSALHCATTAVPVLVRAEGITERTGDVVFTCAGGVPGSRFIENLTIFLNVDVTNRIDANNVTDMVLSADSGSGLQAVSVPGVLVSPTTVTWNGVQLTLSPRGSIVLRFANIRGNATAASPDPGGQIAATINVSGSSVLAVDNPSLVVAVTTPGLYSNQSSTQICNQNGASVPANASFAGFIAAQALFYTTRVTEGFAAALAPKSDTQNFDADTGHRIMVRYSGYPAGAQLYLPVAVAGSDALQPTAGGDFGPPAAGGKYAPGGSLLLSLVQGADANGAGGAPLYTPGPAGSAAVTFDQLQPINIASDGTAYAVYEVMDSSDSTVETAQFPTFVNIPKIFTGKTYQTTENVMLAPVSTVLTASAAAPVPRFVQTIATSDCAVLTDCSANYFPHVSADTAALNFTLTAGNVFYNQVVITNGGSGVMHWSASAIYQDGSGWLILDSPTGINKGVIYVGADARQLGAGTYHATVAVDGGPAGVLNIPVTATVTAPGQGAAPAITSVTSSANFYGQGITAGSLATIIGTNFSASNVTVEFDSRPATILFRNAQQINLLVPSDLTGKTTTQMLLTLDGVKVGPRTVAMTAFAPAIFPGAILNQDSSVNSAAHPAKPGSVLQIFGTGVSPGGVVSGRLAGGVIGRAYFSGAAPGLPGVQQVNLRVPGDVQAGSADLQVCEAVAGSSAAPVCSPAMKVVIGE